MEPPLTVDTSQIWTYAFVPIMIILYKTTPELSYNHVPNGVHSIEVPLYLIE